MWLQQTLFMLNYKLSLFPNSWIGILRVINYHLHRLRLRGERTKIIFLKVSQRGEVKWSDWYFWAQFSLRISLQEGCHCARETEWDRQSARYFLNVQFSDSFQRAGKQVGLRHQGYLCLPFPSCGFSLSSLVEYLNQYMIVILNRGRGDRPL